MGKAPYRSTPIFDAMTLPAGLRRDHRTREGTWGVIRVLAGEIRLHYAEPRRAQIVGAGESAVVAPQETHWVEVLGPMAMQVDFHDEDPRAGRAAGDKV